MDRINALGPEYSARLRKLSGSVLSPELDEDLQRLVEQLAGELSMPIALVSLVLERTQFFRAHHGLPADLAVARSTDRDTSFCQFVVRDGKRFEVTDARQDVRVPQELVERYGVRAYLGEPITLGDSVIGSLCGVDVRPRDFTEDQREKLTAAARKVSARLAALAARPRVPSRALLATAATPAFAEARNLLAPLLANIDSARIAVADIGPLARIGADLARSDGERLPALGVLTRALSAFDDLAAIVEDVDMCARRLHATLAALETLLLPGRDRVSLADVVEAATQLAHHHTKLIGGVAWDAVPPAFMAVPRAVAVSTLASTLSLVADTLAASRSGLPCRVVVEPPSATLCVGAPGADADTLDRCAHDLRTLLGQGDFVGIVAAGGALRVTFPIVAA